MGSGSGSGGSQARGGGRGAGGRGQGAGRTRDGSRQAAGRASVQARINTVRGTVLFNSAVRAAVRDATGRPVTDVRPSNAARRREQQLADRAGVSLAQMSAAVYRAARQQMRNT